MITSSHSGVVVIIAFMKSHWFPAHYRERVKNVDYNLSGVLKGIIAKQIA
jgi:hypothetical protein